MFLLKMISNRSPTTITQEGGIFFKKKGVFRFWNLNIYRLTLNLLTTTMVAPPSNASKCQMGFNSAFKGLKYTYNVKYMHCIQCLKGKIWSLWIVKNIKQNNIKKAVRYKNSWKGLYCIMQCDHWRFGKMRIKWNEFQSSVPVLRCSISVTFSVTYKESANSRTWWNIKGGPKVGIQYIVYFIPTFGPLCTSMR